MYVSKSQIARVRTESWVSEHGYCLACQSDRLLPTVANTQARDFECEVCHHPYELKSAMRLFGSRVVDGAFASMMRRVETNSLPTFLLMQYSQDSVLVTHMSAIHRSLITEELIEKRKPLSLSARRPGWTGCNLLIGSIPPEGRITLIEGGVSLPKLECRTIFQATANLGSNKLASRGWARTLLSRLHKLPENTFTLNDVYAFEHDLSELYPNNRNIRPKIRQQLQVLRDAGLVTFVRPGVYRLTFSKRRNNLPSSYDEYPN